MQSQAASKATSSARSGLLHPESRGRLTLASPDPLVHPRIRANFLEAESDRQTLITGVRIARDILGQSAMKDYCAEEASPGPQRQTDEEILAYPRWPLQIPPSVARSNSPRGNDRNGWIVTRIGWPLQGGWRLL